MLSLFFFGCALSAHSWSLLVRLLGSSFGFFSIGLFLKKNTNVPPKALGCPAVIVQFVQLMCNCSIVRGFGYDTIDAIMTQFNLAYKMLLHFFVHEVYPTFIRHIRHLLRFLVRRMYLFFRQFF